MSILAGLMLVVGLILYGPVFSDSLVLTVAMGLLLIGAFIFGALFGEEIVKGKSK